MKLKNIAQFSNIDDFVADKIKRFNESDRSFEELFEMMFSPRENIMYERSRGYRLIKYTYGEVHDEILSKAASLKEITKEIPSGSTVGIYMDNSLEFIEMMWCILICGYNPILLNKRLPESVIKDTVKSMKVALVISDLGNEEWGSVSIECDNETAPQACRTIPATQVTGCKGDNGTIPAASVVSERHGNETDFEPGIVSAFGTHLYLMSSGTSAKVKICAYTAEEFFYQINDSYRIIVTCKQMKKHYNGELKQLAFLPYYHVFGLVAVYVWFTFFSRTVVELPSLSSRTILKTIQRHEVTHIFAVPLFWETVYRQAVKTIKARGDATFRKFEKGLAISTKIGDVPLLGRAFRHLAFREVRENLFGDSICFMIAGGSRISSETMKFFNGIGYHLADGYGMTEIGITSVELSMKKAVLNACFVGKPLASVEYMISPEGELCVRGKSLASFVIDNGEIRKNTGDWFHTGDLAECIKGHYRIIGRNDDLLIGPSGENINPGMIEREIDIPGISETALVGVNAEGDTVPTLIVSVDKDIHVDYFPKLVQSLKDKLNELNMQFLSSQLLFTYEPLLKGDEFKLNRRRLAMEASNGTIAEISENSLCESSSHESEDSVPENDELLIALKELFAESLQRDEDIDVNADFFEELGGTSLDYLSLLASIEERFDITMPETGERATNTVKDMYRALRPLI